MTTDRKKCQHSFHIIALKKGILYLKMLPFCKNNADISKTKGAQALYVVFPETTKVFALTCQISNL